MSQINKNVLLSFTCGITKKELIIKIRTNNAKIKILLIRFRLKVFLLEKLAMFIR